MKKKLNEEKNLWAERLHEVLWSYHITPHSTKKDTPFRMVYEYEAMLPVDINVPTWRRDNYNNKDNLVGLQTDTDLLCETREMTHIQEYMEK